MDIGILLSILYEQYESIIEEYKDLLQEIEEQELNEINYLLKVEKEVSM